MAGLFARIAQALTGDRKVVEADRPEVRAQVFGQLRSKPATRTEIGMLVAYEEVPSVRAVVDKIASSVAAVPWGGYRYKGPKTGERSVLGGRVRSRRAFVAKLQSIAADGSAESINRRDMMFAKAIAAGEAEPLESHPVVDLISNASEFLTGVETRKVLQASLELTGNAFGILRYAGDNKQVLSVIDPVPPHEVKNVPSLGQTPRSFTVGGSIYGNDREWPAERVLWIKSPCPRDPFGRGVGIMAAAATEISADEEAARTAESRFANGGLPLAVIWYKGASESELQRLERLFTDAHRGWEKAGKPHFTAREVTVQQLDSKIVDLDLVNIRKDLREQIRQTPGIPPEILGIIENSNRSTIDAAAFLFAILILIPRLDQWADNLNNRILPLFGEEWANTFVWYESPLPEDMEARRAMMGTIPEAFTRDEVRQSVGMAKRAEADGEELLEGFSTPPADPGTDPSK